MAEDYSKSSKSSRTDKWERPPSSFSSGRATLSRRRPGKRSTSAHTARKRSRATGSRPRLQAQLPPSQPSPQQNQARKRGRRRQQSQERKRRRRLGRVLQRVSPALQTGSPETTNSTAAKIELRQLRRLITRQIAKLPLRQRHPPKKETQPSMGSRAGRAATSHSRLLGAPLRQRLPTLRPE